MVELLLVEDDDAIAVPLERALAREGYAVTRVVFGEDAVRHVATEPTDVVILDLGLPDTDGIDVCRRIRDSGSDVPIVMLTARGDELDRVVGLDLGADDYLAKPFGLAELLARIRALLRRRDAAPQSTGAPNVASATDDLRVDEGARRVFVDDDEVELTSKEFDLLALFAREHGTVIRRERLMDEVWDTQWYGSTKTLDVTVARLRRKLEEHGARARIVTVRGVGFRLERTSGA